MKCKKCGNKLLTCKSDAGYWEPDSEPYEDGKVEEAAGFECDVHLTAEYCEKCMKFTWIHVDEDELEMKPEKVLKELKEWAEEMYVDYDDPIFRDVLDKIKELEEK